MNDQPNVFQGTLCETRKKSKIDDETLKFIRQKRPHMQSKGRRHEGEGMKSSSVYVFFPQAYNCRIKPHMHERSISPFTKRGCYKVCQFNDVSKISKYLTNGDMSLWFQKACSSALLKTYSFSRQINLNPNIHTVSIGCFIST